jgi:excisionase family DNA binding protein
MDDEHLTYAQTERFINVRLATLYSMVSRHEIPHVRLGRRLVRFSRRALERWLAERTVGA